MAIIGIITTMLVGALADRPDPSRELMLYLDEDTKIPYVCDGEAWYPIGGGGGGGLPPGVAGDGLTPGGLTVLGGVAAAGGNAGILPSGGFYAGDPLQNDNISLGGSTVVYDNVASQANGADVCDVFQGASDISANTGGNASYVRRTQLNTSPYDYTDEMVRWDYNAVRDTTDIHAIYRRGTRVYRLSPAGGVGMFGHAPPTAPRTLAQATIDAITDANAKTAVQACANALADMGALTLT